MQMDAVVVDWVGKLCKQLVGSRMAQAREDLLQNSKQLRLFHVTVYKIAVQMQNTGIEEEMESIVHLCISTLHNCKTDLLSDDPYC